MKVLVDDGRSGSRPLTPRELQVTAWALQHFSTTAYRAGFDGNDALEARRLCVEFARAFKSSTAGEIAASQPVQPWPLPVKAAPVKAAPVDVVRELKALARLEQPPPRPAKRQFQPGCRVRHIDMREGVARTLGIAEDQVTPCATVDWDTGGVENVALGFLEPMPPFAAAVPSGPVANRPGDRGLQAPRAGAALASDAAGRDGPEQTPCPAQQSDGQ